MVYSESQSMQRKQYQIETLHGPTVFHWGCRAIRICYIDSNIQQKEYHRRGLFWFLFLPGRKKEMPRRRGDQKIYHYFFIFKRSARITFSLDRKSNQKDQGGCNLNELSFHIFKFVYLAVLAPQYYGDSPWLEHFQCFDMVRDLSCNHQGL